MSVSGTSHTTAAHRSGRRTMHAATSSPPLDPPRMARRSRDVRPFATSQSAAASKSAKTWGLLARIPAWCHASPSSPPPRSPGTATWPPCSHHTAMNGLHAGVSVMLKPPYPVSSVGVRGSIVVAAACTSSIGTATPSVDG